MENLKTIGSCVLASIPAWGLVAILGVNTIFIKNVSFEGEDYEVIQRGNFTEVNYNRIPGVYDSLFDGNNDGTLDAHTRAYCSGRGCLAAANVTITPKDERIYEGIKLQLIP